MARRKKEQPDVQDAPDNGHQDTFDDLANIPWLRYGEDGLSIVIGNNGVDSGTATDPDPEEMAAALRVKTVEYDELVDGSEIPPDLPDVITHEDDIPETPAPLDLAVLPKTMYVITRQGVALKRDPALIRQVAERMDDQNLNKFVAFNHREPVLIALVKGTGSLYQLALPDASKITTTPAQLYSKAITYPKIISRLVKRRVDGGQDKFAKTSKLVWVIALSVITLFIIFMLVVVAMDDGGSGSDTAEQTNQQAVPVNPSSQQADLDISPTPTSGTHQDDPRVIVPPAEGN